jgi:hypothetical protein
MGEAAWFWSCIPAIDYSIEGEKDKDGTLNSN